MKRSQNVFTKKTSIRKGIVVLFSIIAGSFTFVSCSDDQAEMAATAEAVPLLSDLEVVTPEVTKGSFLHIKGDVGNSMEALKVFQNGEEAAVVSFDANQGVTVQLSEEAVSGPLTVEVEGTEMFLGSLNILDNLVLPVFWVEADVNGTTIFRGRRSLFGNTSRTGIVSSTGFISALAASPLTGEIFYVVQDTDPVTFEPISQIVKADAKNGTTKQVVLQTSGLINALAASVLAGKVFYAETSFTDFLTSVKEVGMNGGTPAVLQALGPDTVTEMDYSFITNSIYFVDAQTGINSVSRNDNSLTVVYGNENFRILGGMAVDPLGNDLYVADLGEPGDDSDVILKGSVDGSSPLTQFTATDVSATLSMDFDRLGGKLYWLNSSFTGEPTGSIYRSSVNNVSPELVFDGIGLALSIEVTGRNKKEPSIHISL
ncbi:hypothetical protein [Ascidiimonas aurantiaca]|uniref:hypothetical protein n=1 Tax=Ascidiimonas aurantiaca TaxID=1685432 RepID=UPI0030EE8A9B